MTVVMLFANWMKYELERQKKPKKATHFGSSSLLLLLLLLINTKKTETKYKRKNRMRKFDIYWFNILYCYNKESMQPSKKSKLNSQQQEDQT